MGATPAEALGSSNERRHDDVRHLRVRPHFDHGCPRLLGGCHDLELVISRIHRNGRPPLGAPDVRAVAADLQTARARLDRNVDDELRERRRERVRPLARALRPVRAVPQVRSGGRVLVGHPRARGLPVLLVAVPEIEKRSGPGIEALALRELGAGLAELSIDHELTRFIEERLCRGLARRALGERFRRREDRERECDERGATETCHRGQRTCGIQGGRQSRPLAHPGILAPRTRSIAERADSRNDSSGERGATVVSRWLGGERIDRDRERARRDSFGGRGRSSGNEGGPATRPPAPSV